MDFRRAINHYGCRPSRRVTSGSVLIETIMTKIIEAPASVAETEHERFARILLRPQFKPLKDVLDNLGKSVPTLFSAILTTNCYQMFLGKIGYRIEVVKQIHENDCYARIGPAGGIRAVLPLHNPATYSTMVTLVNFNASVTTTSNSVDYYDGQLAEFKTQLMSRSGNAG